MHVSHNYFASILFSILLYSINFITRIWMALEEYTDLSIEEYLQQFVVADILVRMCHHLTDARKRESQEKTT